MSLFGTLNTGASGLGTSSTSMSVIGDNIANINTTGFKGSRASFEDMLPNMIGGNQLGTGSSVAGTQTLFGQGSLSSSSSALDMAISGKGFFQVSDGQQDFYTRDGSMYMDAEGFLVNSSGYHLQGYNAFDGSVTSRISDLQIDTAPTGAKATESIDISAYLPMQDEPTDGWDTYLSDTDTTGGTDVTWDDLDENADNSTSITIYDELGKPHDVVVYFEQVSETEYDYTVVAATSELDPTADADGEGYVTGLISGTLTFDSDGQLESATQSDIATSSWPGTSAIGFEVDFGVDSAGESTDGGSMTMQGEDFSVTGISQDGYAVGELSSVQLDDEGNIVANYSNGEEEILGQVALATFAAEGFLTRAGGNMFAANAASGDPAMGAAGVGGRGSVTGYALEGSNVELEDQFVAMIQSQRGYQANARVISTANDTLQELVNLV
ncbi:MAG: flagellar hook protein FlgE [Proteobacteria bacterium]|nr:flagellar hook protein FlgE [Pseudomonadota bacterium]MCP4919858.1 flagellar hook protein FlgE [Pseudomonadota bacterium]